MPKRRRHSLTTLPEDLLLQILILSGNPSLALVSRRAYLALGYATPAVHYRFLLALANGDEMLAMRLGLEYRFLSVRLLDQFQLRHNGYWVGTDLLRAWSLPVWLFSTLSSQDKLAAPTPQSPDGGDSGTSRPRKRKQPEDPPEQQLQRAERQPQRQQGRKGYREIYQERLEIVQRLLEWGVPADCRNSFPLIKSCQLGLVDMVRLLLSFNAKPDLNDNMALCLAATRGHYKIVKLLVKAGAPLESRVLRYAVQKQQWKVVNYLMKKGAVPDFETIKMYPQTAAGIS
ncbi:hypothetical protein EV182_007144 [Spiromyces aspiralis]|uniref:Uncharacterized protein n=1 Tax=Spiromyces aspiralis TaxID=68401 RepID=A0ACC1HSS2_9FUNG|nr:hypothetical protein EV182_007144 [Spiromyces aspiralis]